MNSNMNLDLIRAWKDEEYRDSLSAEQLAALPGNPAGLVELREDELAGVEGGSETTLIPLSILVTVSVYSYYKGCFSKVL